MSLFHAQGRAELGGRRRRRCCGHLSKVSSHQAQATYAGVWAGAGCGTAVFFFRLVNHVWKPAM
jgi:hypothetical protein